jgi:putative ABC transport system ATP-binding protein
MSQLNAEARRGAIVVVATHDPAVVAAADRNFILDDGVLTDHIEPVSRLHAGFGG